MAGSERKLLKKPPYEWISWLVLVAYFAVFIQSISLFLKGGVNGVWTRNVFEVVQQMWVIYGFETFLAVGPAWCAMSGWTASDVLIHHVPYVLATGTAKFLNYTAPWIDAFAISTLTCLNEGLLVGISLGLPEWVAKGRRFYGFFIIVLLSWYEFKSWAAQMMFHWHTGWSNINLFHVFFLDHVVLLGLAYHISLIQLYVRGWRKRGSLRLWTTRGTSNVLQLLQHAN